MIQATDSKTFTIAGLDCWKFVSHFAAPGLLEMSQFNFMSSAHGYLSLRNKKDGKQVTFQKLFKWHVGTAAISDFSLSPL